MLILEVQKVIKDSGAVGFSETCTQTAMEINRAGTSKHMLKVKGELKVKGGCDNLPYVLSKCLIVQSIVFSKSPNLLPLSMESKVIIQRPSLPPQGRKLPHYATHVSLAID